MLNYEYLNLRIYDNSKISNTIIERLSKIDQKLYFSFVELISQIINICMHM